MGLFSDKKKTIVGFSYIDLGDESVGRYYDFRRNLLFSAAGDFDFYQMSMWRYKTSFRRRYSQEKLDSLGFTKERKAISSTTYNEFNAIQDTSQISTLNYDDIYKPVNGTEFSPIEDETYLIERNLQIWQENWYLSNLTNEIRNGVLWVSVSDSDTPRGSTEHFTIEYTHVSKTRYNDQSDLSPVKQLSFKNFSTYEVRKYIRNVYWAKYDGDKFHSYDIAEVDDWVNENVPYGQDADRWTEEEDNYTDEEVVNYGDFVLDVDPERYHYHIRGLNTSGEKISVAVPRYMYDRGFIADQTRAIHEFDIAPMITLKTDNQSVVEEDGETSETTVEIENDDYLGDLLNYHLRTTTTVTTTTNRTSSEDPDAEGRYQVKKDISTTTTIKREKLDDEDNVIESSETTTITNDVKFLTINTSPDLAEKTRKALPSYGLSMEAIEPYLKNEDIDDFFVTLSISPEDATGSREMSKALFQTLSMYLGGEQAIIDSNGGSAVPVRYKIDLSSENSNAHMEFNLSSSIKQGNVLTEFGNVVKWKIKTKQNITNQDKFYDDVKEIYDEAGLSGKTTTADMYIDILKKINDEESNGTYEKRKHPLRKGLPSRDAMNDRKPLRTYYISCKESEIEEKMKKNMSYGDVVICSIISHTPIGSSDELKKYYAESGTYNTYKIGDDGYPQIDNDSAASRGVKVRKQIDDNRYIEITISHGQTSYKPDASPVAIKKWDSENKDFRVPVSSDILVGKTFYELIELYDYLVAGIAFTKVVQRIKWYQTGLFATILQIFTFVVAVAITVLTGGAGATIGTAIVSVAQTLAIAYATTLLVNKLLDALGVDDPYIRAAVKIAVALTTGDFDMSAIISSLNKISEAYMQHELQEIIDESKKLAKQAKEFYKKMKEKEDKLRDEERGMTPSRTVESIIANIINSDLQDDDSDGDYTVYSGLEKNITAEVMENMQDTSWMVPPLQRFSFTPAKVLPEKGIIEDNRIRIESLDISMGVEANTIL